MSTVQDIALAIPTDYTQPGIFSQQDDDMFGSETDDDEVTLDQWEADVDDEEAETTTDVDDDEDSFDDNDNY